MNTFFRICIYFCIGILVFTLAINFINSLSAFPVPYEAGQESLESSNILSRVTGLSDPSMNGLWLLVTGTALAVGGAVSVLTHSVTPIGVAIFADVFWTSWIHMWSVTQLGGYIPTELSQIFFIGVLFLFIAALIGMLTGSG